MGFRKLLLWAAAVFVILVLASGCIGGASVLSVNEPTVAVTMVHASTVTSTPTTPSGTPTIFFVPTLIPTATGTPTPTGTPTATPPARTLAPARDGIWISAEELAALPMSGRAWERLKEAADGQLEEANMAGHNANHDVQTLAVALVYARTGDDAYREKAAEAIRATIGTEHTGVQGDPGSEQGAVALTVSRNLVAYVIAADLIDLASYNAQLDREFRIWLIRLLEWEWVDGSLISQDEKRANNHGRVAGASRAAVAAYLGNEAELLRAAAIFKGFLGDRTAYTGFEFDSDLSWQANPFQPVGINPVGAEKDGFVIDGALPEEMRRGCSFQLPPCPTEYPWGALQGIVVEAVILHRQGFDVWDWQDQAILRAVQFLHDLQQDHPDDVWWATGDDTWIPWLINYYYGTEFPTETTKAGKNMGWTDWTHAAGGSD